MRDWLHSWAADAAAAAVVVGRMQNNIGSGALRAQPTALHIEQPLSV